MSYKTVLVYFSEIARTLNINLTPEAIQYVRALKFDSVSRCYLASTRLDYLALAKFHAASSPHEVR